MSDKYQLYQGDCLSFMRGMDAENVDAVITDPPYGVNAKTGWVDTSFENEIPWNSGSILNDKDFAMRDFIIKWSIKNNKPLAVFGSARLQEPDNYIARLIWDKGDAAGMGNLTIPWKPNYDFIHIYGNLWKGKRDTSILSVQNISRISMGRCHPHEKPVSLLKKIINKLPKNITIFDPFMGSGTTGVACMQLGRKFIGCELDPAYFAIAEKRIKAAASQEIMF